MKQLMICFSIITNTLWTIQGDHGLTQKTDTTITDSSNPSYTFKTPTAVTYNAATGEMVITSELMV